MDAGQQIRLGAWLDVQGLEVGQPLRVEPLVGGRSNVMSVIERGASRWVLRRPANVAIDRANEGMSREFRFLSGLQGTDVPHPEVVALCADPAVLGGTFYLMEKVEGVRPIPPPPALDDDVHRRQIAFAMVDALARLHEVDWRAAGLGDLGHPDQFHERQVRRWSRQLASYEGRQLPGIDEVMTWLDGHRPVSFVPTIMHADFHMLNVLIAPDAPGRVVAIVDWETATIGDPLLDLAGFYELWCSVATTGWPDQASLVARYREVRHLGELGDLTYYEALYHFRLGVLLEGIYQRSLRDATRPVDHESGERALFEVSQAVARISGRSSS